MAENELANFSQQERTNWKSWIGHDFEIQYPPSWSTNVRDNHIFFEPPNFETYPDGKAVIALPIVAMSIQERETEWLASDSLEDLINDFLRFKARGFRGFELIKKSYYRAISGEKGVLLTYDYIIGRLIGRLHVRTVQGIVIKEKRWYEIHGEARKEKFLRYETDFVNLIESLIISGKRELSEMPSLTQYQ